MDKSNLYDAIIKRMNNFNLSFEEAIKEIEEMYPQYSDALKEFKNPFKIQIEISAELWENMKYLMQIVSNRECTEEERQRQLGVVSFLYDKEFE